MTKMVNPQTATDKQIADLQAQIARLESTKHIADALEGFTKLSKTPQDRKLQEEAYSVAKRFCNSTERARRQEAKNE